MERKEVEIAVTLGGETRVLTFLCPVEPRYVNSFGKDDLYGGELLNYSKGRIAYQKKPKGKYHATYPHAVYNVTTGQWSAKLYRRPGLDMNWFDNVPKSKITNLDLGIGRFSS